MERPQPTPFRVRAALGFFLRVNALTTGLCLVVELLCWRLGLPETYRNPFYVGVARLGLRFFDFDSFQQRFHDLHTFAYYRTDTFFSFSYPAPAAIVYAAFYALGPEASLNTFLAFSLVGFLVVAGCFARALLRQGLPAGTAAAYTASLVALAFPFWFCFQRGNLEILVFVLLAAALLCFLRERPFAAAVLIAFAGSLKVVPLIFLVLLFSRRQYRAVAVGLGLAGVLNLFGLWFLGPSVSAAWHGLRRAAADRQGEMLTHLNPDGIGFDHSPLAIFFRLRLGLPTSAAVLHGYVIATVCLAVGLYVFRVRRLPMLNQLLCLTLFAVVFPPTSFEYTLMHLYLPAAALVLSMASGPASTLAGVRPHLLLLALLVSPASEFIRHGVRFGAQVQCVLLLGLLVLSLVRPLPSRFDAPPA